MSQQDLPPPRISICIPLYAAAPWFERIAANIRRNAAPDVEFVLSDRHGLDDTLERLQQLLSGEARLRCCVGRDALNWIGNYNLLLREARGEYVRILSQDDVLDPQSLAAATAAFSANSNTALVVGPTDLIDVQGVVLHRDVRRPASRVGRSPGRARFNALLLFGGLRYANTNMGMIRRRVASAPDPSIPHTAGETGLSVRVLMFAVALSGQVQYVPGYCTQRCVHPDSFTAIHWRRSASDQYKRMLSYMQAGLAAWRSTRMPLACRLLGYPAICAGAVALPALQLVRHFGSRFKCVRAAMSRSGQRAL